MCITYPSGVFEVVQLEYQVTVLHTQSSTYLHDLPNLHKYQQ